MAEELEKQETPEVEAAEEAVEESTSPIDKLASMGDAELGEILGYNRKLSQVREDLAKMVKLTGKARELAEEKVARLLTPDISEYQFRYALEDAQREAKPKQSGKQAYADDSPTSVV